VVNIIELLNYPATGVTDNGAQSTDYGGNVVYRFHQELFGFILRLLIRIGKPILMVNCALAENTARPAHHVNRTDVREFFQLSTLTRQVQQVSRSLGIHGAGLAQRNAKPSVSRAVDDFAKAGGELVEKALRDAKARLRDVPVHGNDATPQVELLRSVLLSCDHHDVAIGVDDLQSIEQPAAKQAGSAGQQESRLFRHYAATEAVSTP